MGLQGVGKCNLFIQLRAQGHYFFAPISGWKHMTFLTSFR